MLDARSVHELLDDYRLTFDMFRNMCILAGCDYLPNLRGVGMKIAQKIVYQARAAGQSSVGPLDISILQKIRPDLELPPNYAVDFANAWTTFVGQTYYDFSTG
jgi:exonuclease-1